MKKTLSAFVALAAAGLLLFAGCARKEGAQKADAKTASAATEAAPAPKAAANEASVVGPDNAVAKYQMWTFVDLHQQFYSYMLQQWNKAHPDKTIQITFTNYPFDDMNSKLLMAVQTGKGAPDLCDVEINVFPNYMKGKIPFVVMDDYIKPYQQDIVPARLSAYAKNGHYYGIPTHVGATVMYYNQKALSAAGIDYTTIKTWADFEAAGQKYQEFLKKTDPTNSAKKYFTGADTGGVDWLWVSMAEEGQSWVDQQTGLANVKISSLSDMIGMQDRWIKEGIAYTTPGGQIDREQGYQAVESGSVVAFPKALWYMSRFLNYMPDMKGQWAIAPCPVYKAGQPRSVGIGGTGTIVSTESKNPDLAAQFIAWAKLSKEGCTQIWERLGFDPTNMTLWTDPAITGDKTNKYIAYFQTNPFDVLNEIRNEIGFIPCLQISPTLNEQFQTNVLPSVLQDGEDLTKAIDDAQTAIDDEEVSQGLKN